MEDQWYRGDAINELVLVDMVMMRGDLHMLEAPLAPKSSRYFMVEDSAGGQEAGGRGQGSGGTGQGAGGRGQEAGGRGKGAGGRGEGSESRVEGSSPMAAPCIPTLERALLSPLTENSTRSPVLSFSTRYEGVISPVLWFSTRLPAVETARTVAGSCPLARRCVKCTGRSALLRLAKGI